MQAQISIQINHSEVKINNTVVQPFFTIDDYIKILGQPSRKILTAVTSYYYDNLGFQLASENSKFISVIKICYFDKSEFSTTSSFKVSLIVGGYSITGYTSLSSFKSIEDLYIKSDEVMTMLGLYRAAIGTNSFFIAYDHSDTGKLLSIEIDIKY